MKCSMSQVGHITIKNELSKISEKIVFCFCLDMVHEHGHCICSPIQKYNNWSRLVLELRAMTKSKLQIWRSNIYISNHIFLVRSERRRNLLCILSSFSYYCYSIVGGSIMNSIRAFCRKSSMTTCVSPKVRTYEINRYEDEGYFSELSSNTEVNVILCIYKAVIVT